MYKKYQDIGKLHPLICKNKALNIMKISILLLLFGIFSVSATQDIHRKPESPLQ